MMFGWRAVATVANTNEAKMAAASAKRRVQEDVEIGMVVMSFCIVDSNFWKAGRASRRWNTDETRMGGVVLGDGIEMEMGFVCVPFDF